MAFEPPRVNLKTIELGITEGFSEDLVSTLRWCLRSMAVERMFIENYFAGGSNRGSGSNTR